MHGLHVMISGCLSSRWLSTPIYRSEDEKGGCIKSDFDTAPFSCIQGTQTMRLAAKKQRGAGLRHGPCRHLSLFAFRQEELPYVVARGNQSPLERHLLKAP